MNSQDTRDYQAELAEYQSHRPQDPNGHCRVTLNNLVDDLQAIQGGDFWRFDFQSFDAHKHEAGADAVGFMVELYGYMRSRLVDAFEAGLFCLNAMNTAAPERQRARGFFRNLLDELRNTPAEPLNPDDPEAVHCEIGLLLFEAVRSRISDSAIAAIKAVADEIESSGNWDNPAYIPNSDAVKLSDNRLTLSRLSKILDSGEGGIRFVRRGNRCKIHIDDARRLIEKIKAEPDYFTEAAFNQYMNDAEETKKQIQKEKTRQR